MIRNVRAYALTVVCMVAPLAVTSANAVPHLQKTAAVAEEVALFRVGGANYSYTLEQLSFSTQMQPVIDGTAPYFFFLLTNTGDDDTYHMVVSDIDDPLNWFGQVCIGFLCFPDSLDHPLTNADSDSVGVNVVPFTDGVDTFTFTLSSLGNPALVSVYELTLYAGSTVVDVRPISGVDSFELRQNSPNPVRAATSIQFALPREEAVSLRIYDVSGRIVRTLSEGSWPAGSHRVAWDGKSDTGGSVPTGVYFYRLVTPEGELARRMTVIR